MIYHCFCFRSPSSCSIALSPPSLSGFSTPSLLLPLPISHSLQTKAGVNRAIDWIKDDKEIAETKLMAARPPPALLKQYRPAAEAANLAVGEAAGTSVSVPGGATVEHAEEKGAKSGGGGTAKELAVASSVDVTSGAELAAALSAGEIQSIADALIAVVAEQAPPPAPEGGPGKSDVAASLVNEAVAGAVTELILTTRESTQPAAAAAAAAAAAEPGEARKALSRLEALGVAFGAALREAALGADPLAIADSLVAGIQGAAVPCAADVNGPGATKNTTAWFAAAAKKCCGPVALSTMRAAQASVNDGPDAARVALYSALSRSVDLGGPGSFALARCSPPNAKE